MIQIRKLTKTYANGTRALKNVSLTVGPGLFGLLGPNGAGKSTMMRILVGLLAPTSGSIAVDGVDIGQHPEAIQRRLGYLPQDFGFYPHLSGEQMLRHLIELKGVCYGRRARLVAEHALARVGLGGAGRRRVRDYSGGMRQRLGIAQALVGSPKILVLDEPSTGLDPAERDRFHRVLATLAEECPILLSTHHVEDVANLASRFALLAGGRLVADTTPDEACRALGGRVYEGCPGDDAMKNIAAHHLVTQSFLVQGRNRVRIVAGDGSIPEGFAAVGTTLADAYAAMLHDAARASRLSGG